MMTDDDDAYSTALSLFGSTATTTATQVPAPQDETQYPNSHMTRNSHWIDLFPEDE
jgi:hypothetical protein